MNAKTLLSIVVLSGCTTVQVEPEKEEVNYQIVGDITSGTLKTFKEDSETYNIKTVSLNSYGGSLFSAIALGYIIHKKGINTYVAKDAVCMSACGYIFLAGKKKVLLNEIGIHEIAWGVTPYHELSNNSKASITEMHWIIANYLGLIGVHYTFVKDSFKTFSDDMIFLNASQLNKYIVSGYLISE